MIKPISDVILKIEGYPKWSMKEDELKEYAISIIDECAGNFECTMETNGVPGQEDEYPVLVRASIEAVKKQIK